MMPSPLTVTASACTSFAMLHELCPVNSRRAREGPGELKLRTSREAMIAEGFNGAKQVAPMACVGILLYICGYSTSGCQCGSANASVPALFVFGDSSVDCGTNNYIITSDIFRGDFPPNGQDFFEKPTSRYSNGRIIIDFIAEYAGKPFILPYLEPNADLSHGANFASGGSGALMTTFSGLVVDFQKQLSQFLHHKSAVTQQHGQAFAQGFFLNAVYIVSIGSNDYLGGYFGPDPNHRENYTPEQFCGYCCDRHC